MKTQMNNVKNEKHVVCPRCKQEVYKEAITCPFVDSALWYGLRAGLMKMGIQ